MATADSVWEACLVVIRDNVSPQCFQTWFTPLEAVTLEEEDGFSKLTLRVPGPFHYEYLEGQYNLLLRTTLTRVLGEKNRLYYEVVVIQEDPGPQETKNTYQVPASDSVVHHTPVPQPETTAPSVVKSQLMENYTFD
ncbi:MAG: hypothetical protein F4058_03535, partial [Rhodothermaceae bacterium]|nr:hypothetical protein [Rhodothermaceae bacterium]MYI84389.1 hypothetical protein [Rhodothermaceae bacterium]